MRVCTVIFINLGNRFNCDSQRFIGLWWLAMDLWLLMIGPYGFSVKGWPKKWSSLIEARGLQYHDHWWFTMRIWVSGTRMVHEFDWNLELGGTLQRSADSWCKLISSLWQLRRNLQRMPSLLIKPPESLWRPWKHRFRTREGFDLGEEINHSGADMLTWPSSKRLEECGVAQIESQCWSCVFVEHFYKTVNLVRKQIILNKIF